MPIDHIRDSWLSCATLFICLMAFFWIFHMFYTFLHFIIKSLRYFCPSSWPVRFVLSGHSWAIWIPSGVSGTRVRGVSRRHFSFYRVCLTIFSFKKVYCRNCNPFLHVGSVRLSNVRRVLIPSFITQSRIIYVRWKCRLLRQTPSAFWMPRLMAKYISNEKFLVALIFYRFNESSVNCFFCFETHITMYIWKIVRNYTNRNAARCKRSSAGIVLYTRRAREPSSPYAVTHVTCPRRTFRVRARINAVSPSAGRVHNNNIIHGGRCR